MTNPNYGPVSRSGGFTLIELLVVIGILGVLAAALLPRVLGAQENANIFADSKNLEEIYGMHLQLKERKRATIPREGGHKFVLAPWIYEVCEHTEANRDRFFTPGKERQDQRYQELLQESPKDIWRSFDELDSEDTHYAGRAGKHLRTMWSGNEVMMANDGEFEPAFKDGSINIIMGNGDTKTLRWVEDLRDVVGGDDEDRTVTPGPDCPVEELQKLAN